MNINYPLENVMRKTIFSVSFQANIYRQNQKMGKIIFGHQHLPVLKYNLSGAYTLGVQVSNLPLAPTALGLFLAMRLYPFLGVVTGDVDFFYISLIEETEYQVI